MAVVFWGCGEGGGGSTPAQLIVTSAPVGDAEVIVDGIAYGQAPVTVSDVGPGSVVVALEKEGFKRTVQTVEVPEGAGAMQWAIELNSKVGYVTLASRPQGAQVYLDEDNYLGQTPLADVSVPVGPHLFAFLYENHESERRDLVVEEDYKYTLTPDLKPLPAELSVLSVPTGATIWLNEEVQTKTTPSKFSLMPGTYTVSVHAKGYMMKDTVVQLGPNERRSLDVALVPGNTPPNMVLVPGGTFVMGVDAAAPDERPRREINLPAFYIDRNEVTNAEFKRVFPNHTFPEGHGRFPASSISFNEAVEYAGAIGKRLPTEEEWEKAARGTDAIEYPWGNEFDKTKCNCRETGKGATEEVGSRRLGISPNGCLDMAGNVYEWTSSWYQPYPGNPDVKKDYGQIFRVLRGGSYNSTPFQVRCVSRHYDRMDVRRPEYGFRCAQDVE